MPVEVTYVGTNAQLALYPQTPWGWSTVTATAYSGSTSSNSSLSTNATGGSTTNNLTYSTMSYYVQPLAINQPVAASRIELIGSFNTGAAGTGSATLRNYFGLYKINSDSLSLVSSWLAGVLYTQNSATAITLSAYTGSASGTYTRISGNSSNSITGARLMPGAAGSAVSVIPAGQFYGVFGMHSITSGISPLVVSLGVQANTYISLGYDPAQTLGLGPLVGAFSSTSATYSADSNQWLMPPSVATNAVTATRSQDQLRVPVMFRGI
jgi:hypothetical protein